MLNLAHRNAGPCVWRTTQALWVVLVLHMVQASHAGVAEDLNNIVPRIHRPFRPGMNRCESDANHVLVIGAGISGLTSALALQHYGCKVTVLEARSFPGGRLHLDQDTGLDVGGQWVHGSVGNPIRELALHFNMTTVYVGGDSTNIGGDKIKMFGPDGAPYDQGTLDRVRSRVAAIYADIEERRESLEHSSIDFTVRDAIDMCPVYQSLTAIEKTQVNWFFEIFYGGDMAASPSELSLRYFQFGYMEFGGGDSEFEGGFGSLMPRLAEGVKNLVFNSTVTHVEWMPNAVKAITNGGQEFHADAAVITVSLGVLKRNTGMFSPPLPAVKLESISRLRMGCLNKVALLFDKVFWEKAQYTYGYISKVIGEYPMIVNTYVSRKIPALIFMVGGERCWELELQSDNTIVADAMKVVRTLFGEESPPPVDHMVTRWGSDPFALGSYTIVPMGSTLPTDIRNLAQEVEDTLYFAGEHTSGRSFGMSYGGYFTGLREVGKIAGKSELLSGEFVDHRHPFWQEGN